jgi:hypothetical protein
VPHSEEVFGILAPLVPVKKLERDYDVLNESLKNHWESLANR